MSAAAALTSADRRRPGAALVLGAWGLAGLALCLLGGLTQVANAQALAAYPTKRLLSELDDPASRIAQAAYTELQRRASQGGASEALIPVFVAAYRAAPTSSTSPYRLIELIGMVGGPKARAALMDLLENGEKRISYHVTIARRLQRLGDRSGINWLLKQVLEPSRSINDKRYYVQSLLALKDAEVFRTLRAHLLPETPEDLLTVLVERLGEFGDEVVVPDLKALLGAKLPDALVLKIHVALVRLGQRGDHFDAVLKALTERALSWQELQAVTIALRKTHNAKFDKALRDWLAAAKDAKDLQLRLILINALVARRDRKILAQLERILREQKEGTSILQAAMRGVAELGGEGYKALFLHLADNAKLIEIRIDAAKLLAGLDDFSRVRVIVAALTHEQVGIRRRAASALGEVRVRSAIEPLLDACLDVDPYTRQSAWYSLQATIRSYFPYRKLVWARVGYNPRTGTDEQRKAAIEKLRKWYADTKS